MGCSALFCRAKIISWPVDSRWVRIVLTVKLGCDRCHPWTAVISSWQLSWLLEGKSAQSGFKFEFEFKLSNGNSISILIQPLLLYLIKGNDGKYFSVYGTFAPTQLVKSMFQNLTTRDTQVSWIIEHIEIKEHSVKFAEKLIVEHLFYTISIATNKRTPGIFSHSTYNQTRLTIRDTEVVTF